ncbi:hypothetical protein [Geothrix sp. 21YS21S-2]|uniref:hypothetical protein n=1 Tax=Geothrix sp. 21YS21S-2 TaxID=3068893 RepID=UPI0027B9D867|nr:hypothetical protein [Geothrix sp. 21YS21S-2]
MAQPSMEVTQQAPKAGVKSLTGFVLTGPEKGVILCVLLGLMYLRLYRRKRSQDKICSHCGTRNPPHQTNCRQCSAPLFHK